MQTYTITVTGTLPAPDNRAFSPSFTLAIANACLSATITAPTSLSITYQLVGLANTVIAGPFYSSNPLCTISYSLFNGVNQVLSGDPLFAFDATTLTLTIGPSIDNTFLTQSPYSLSVQASFDKGTAIVTSSITVTL